MGPSPHHQRLIQLIEELVRTNHQSPLTHQETETETETETGTGEPCEQEEDHGPSQLDQHLQVQAEVLQGTVVSLDLSQGGTPILEKELEKGLKELLYKESTCSQGVQDTHDVLHLQHNYVVDIHRYGQCLQVPLEPRTR